MGLATRLTSARKMLDFYYEAEATGAIALKLFLRQSPEENREELLENDLRFPQLVLHRHFFKSLSTWTLVM